jgi:ubiquinone/menaquinone biosynthesis C-methylase UbiE
VIQEIAAARPARALNAALDVACGTGHSTGALTALAPVVCACDASPAMLSTARQEASSALFVRSNAESLPFSQRAFDLVTVSMAFHWFDQQRFLGEAARVLAAGGELWVYNLLFPGVLFGDETFLSWHRERYLVRYPVPARHSETLASLLHPQQLPLVFTDERKLSYEVSFAATELRSYLTTQSNIEAALRRGASLRDVNAWFDSELAPFFRDAASHRFAYIGYAEIAVAS